MHDGVVQYIAKALSGFVAYQRLALAGHSILLHRELYYNAREA